MHLARTLRALPGPMAYGSDKAMRRRLMPTAPCGKALNLRQRMTYHLPSGCAGCLFDRGANTHIGAATADIPCHGGVDIGIIRMRRRTQKRGLRHDLAGLAIAALDDF